MSIKEEITKAIAAHAAWKARLRAAIDAGTSDVNATDVGKDNVCPFGQWLYGPTIEAAAKDGTDYQEVRKLHAEFHKAASQVLHLALQGKKTEAEKMMAQDNLFGVASMRLTSAMTRWRTHSGE
ncbi:MAG TPA: CZB domain-containing protein [Candidatus Cybelea sp.]|nr:CZB domain-containing protein [Candidatus Cybelea sp.]